MRSEQPLVQLRRGALILGPDLFPERARALSSGTRPTRRPYPAPLRRHAAQQPGRSGARARRCEPQVAGAHGASHLRRGGRLGARLRERAGQPGPRADARRTQASEREKIYIGKGRVVSDDPKKYPVRAACGVVRCAAQVARASRAVARPAQRRRRCQRHSGHLLWRAERATRVRHARVVSRAAVTQGRDAGGLVGGWAGGEKELKDWAAVPFSPIDPALRKAMNDFSDKKEVSCAPMPHACPSLTARLCSP